MSRSYENIINLPHYTSKTRPRMSIEARAAQFSPFAALTGYEEEITETARLTDEMRGIEEDQLNSLDFKIQDILSVINSKPKIKVTYFIPDGLKAGGSYADYVGELRRIDEIEKCLIFTDGTMINIEKIFNISMVET